MLSIAASNSSSSLGARPISPLSQYHPSRPIWVSLTIALPHLGQNIAGFLSKLYGGFPRATSYGLLAAQDIAAAPLLRVRLPDDLGEPLPLLRTLDQRSQPLAPRLFLLCAHHPPACQLPVRWRLRLKVFPRF